MAPIKSYRGKVRKLYVRDLEQDSIFERLLGNDKPKVFDSSPDPQNSSGSFNHKTRTTDVISPEQSFHFFGHKEQLLIFPSCDSPEEKRKSGKVKYRKKERNGIKRKKAKHKQSNSFLNESSRGTTTTPNRCGIVVNAPDLINPQSSVIPIQVTSPSLVDLSLTSNYSHFSQLKYACSTPIRNTARGSLSPCFAPAKFNNDELDTNCTDMKFPVRASTPPDHLLEFESISDQSTQPFLGFASPEKKCQSVKTLPTSDLTMSQVSDLELGNISVESTQPFLGFTSPENNCQSVKKPPTFVPQESKFSLRRTVLLKQSTINSLKDMFESESHISHKTCSDENISTCEDSSNDFNSLNKVFKNPKLIEPSFSERILLNQPSEDRMRDATMNREDSIINCASFSEEPVSALERISVLTPPNKSARSPPSVIILESPIQEHVSVNDIFLEDSVQILKEYLVLPVGKKFRRSMSIARHLATKNLDDNTLNHSHLKSRNYMSTVESIGLQLTGDNRYANKRHENSAVENIEIQLSGLNLNDREMNSKCFNKRSMSILPLPSLPQLSGIDGKEDTDYKEMMLKLCNQKEPCRFDELFGQDSLEKCRKIGEGVYGEVFTLERRAVNNKAKPKRNVLKIIPIEGDFRVNGEPQKSYGEVCTELVISNVLDGLKNGGEGFMTKCFTELIRSWLVQGRYPDRFIELWYQYNQTKGSDNDSPTIFPDNQLYLVLEVGNAGTDVENYAFSTASQALSVFKQVVFSLAVAESAHEFEHRDLHWGNVLVSKTKEHILPFTLADETYFIKTDGVKATIIDYTLSSITVDQKRIYNDIGKDPDMFTATGDYQFDIYRHMKDDLKNNWKAFCPKTNVRWLHYLLDKLICSVHYSKKKAQGHKADMKKLKEIESWILNYDTSVQVGLRIADET